MGREAIDALSRQAIAVQAGDEVIVGREAIDALSRQAIAVQAGDEDADEQSAIVCNDRVVASPLDAVPQHSLGVIRVVCVEIPCPRESLQDVLGLFFAPQLPSLCCVRH